MQFDDLVALVRDVLAANGCSDRVATILAENCVSAERDGAHSHGLFRLPGYVQSLRSGWVDGQAVPEVEDAAPGLVRVDARNGFAQPALAAGRELLLDKARHNGIALMAIRDSHHFAALSFDVEPFAEAGFVALSVVNSLTAVVPHGARKPVYGTNPIAFAAPREKGGPIVFDMATSVMAKGDVRLAAKEGRALPPGVGVDRDGRDTTDPQAVLDGGALKPFGGHKGSALCMMVEILCAALVGGAFSFEVDWSAFPGAQTPRTGQTVILIDPRAGGTRLPALTARVECLLETLREAGQDRFPGERRRETRGRSLRDGIPVSAETLAAMEAMRQRA